MLDSPTEHYKNGNTYYADKKYDLAVEEYSAAISRDSRQAIIFVNRALSYNQVGTI